MPRAEESGSRIIIVGAEGKVRKGEIVKELELRYCNQYLSDEYQKKFKNRRQRPGDGCGFEADVSYTG